MNASRLLPVLVLGLLSAIGPLAVDMYLPALPSIAQLLGADDGAVQMSLTAFLAAVAVSQLAYGPASDRFGWLTAPSSTVIQPSEVHTGLTDDPEAVLRGALHGRAACVTAGIHAEAHRAFQARILAIGLQRVGHEVACLRRHRVDVGNRAA